MNHINPPNAHNSSSNNISLYSNSSQGTASSMTSNPLATRRHSLAAPSPRDGNSLLAPTIARGQDESSAFVGNSNFLFTPTASAPPTTQIGGVPNGRRASFTNATTRPSSTHVVGSNHGYGPNVAPSPAPLIQSELTLNSLHLQQTQQPHILQHQASTSSLSHNTAPEDTMTEITADEDTLSSAWRVLHCVELIKDPEGLDGYLQEEGIKSVDLLRYCDPEDWQHIASFLRNKPKKRFLELMHQWHLISNGNAAHELLATPLHNSAQSSLAPTHATSKDRTSPTSVDDGDSATDSASAYRIGLPVVGAGSKAQRTRVDHDVPEASAGNIMCSLPEFCVIS
jgi:hypothetical protein